MSGQTTLFMATIAMGLGVGCAYDLFRVLRLVVKHSNFATQVEDGLYWVLVTIGGIILMGNLSNGEMRVFSILGMALGVLLYFVLLSPVLMKLFVWVAFFLKETLLTTVRLVCFPISIVVKMVGVPLGYAKGVSKRAKKPIKKLLQNVARYGKLKKGQFSKNIHIIIKKV